jgi:histidine kinase/DNA gyrase B/HSP90-like ATPase
MTESDYTTTTIWQKTLGRRANDRHANPRARLHGSFLRFRERVQWLVSLIATDMPFYTVHDISHLDGLWEVADTIAGEKYSKHLNPAEAFVLGGSILLHDAGMCLAAYPGGMQELATTVQWRDSVAMLLPESDGDPKPQLISSLPEHIKGAALEQTLRLLHPLKARELPIQKWHDVGSGEDYYLLDDQDLRLHYGALIGQIAESHWWDVGDLEELVPKQLTPMAGLPRDWVVDPIKVACLLRVADAANIDQQRAPRFLQTLVQPRGIAAKHWNFQAKMGKPVLSSDALVYSSQPFKLDEYESWWLCFEMLNIVDRELRAVDILLGDTHRQRFAARRVEGAESPEAAKKHITTSGWEPVDTRLHISNVGRVVEMLGGEQLYGDRPWVTVRELIQNAADGVRARRILDNRSEKWGEIEVAIDTQDHDDWLHVTDNGVGMSPNVMTSVLLDFGNSFWRSALAAKEFPGLQGSGMKATGRFGIGFFSVFMLGEYVQIISRRYDWASDRSYVLEFRHGLKAAPLLRDATPDERQNVRDGGTRISIRLADTTLKGSLDGKKSLPALLASLCPVLDVDLNCNHNGKRAVAIVARDWMKLRPTKLLNRINPHDRRESPARDVSHLVQIVSDDRGQLFGRGWICPKRAHGWDGVVTVGGLLAGMLNGLAGVWLAESTSTVRRDEAIPSVRMPALRKWATKQAQLLEKTLSIPEEQLQCAHIVLACGADLGQLAFCKNADSHLNQDMLRKQITGMSEMWVFESAEVKHDDDWDSVSRSEFEQYFQVVDDPRLFLVDGSKYNFFSNRFLSSHWLFGESSYVVSFNRVEPQWPYTLPDYQSDHASTPYLLLLKIVEEAGGGYEIQEGVDAVVGEVNGEKITRFVDVLTRLDGKQ